MLGPVCFLSYNKRETVIFDLGLFFSSLSKNQKFYMEALDASV